MTSTNSSTSVPSAKSEIRNPKSEISLPLHVAVVGVGRMGLHHVRTYRKLPQAKLVAVVDADLERAQEIAEEFHCHAYACVADLLTAHPDLHAVSVATPTQHHLPAATPLLQHGIACLIEKPLASTSAQANQLVALAETHHAILQVGHTERFNPAVRAVAAMGIPPRFIEVRRVSPMTFRSLDVGVVMDLMIHDLDIVLMLARSPLVQVQAVGVNVLGKHEDVANARLVFANGCVADITASRLALKTERKMRLFSEAAYVSLDYQTRGGVIIRKHANADVLNDARARLAAGSDLADLDYKKLVHVEELTMDLPVVASSCPPAACGLASPSSSSQSEIINPKSEIPADPLTAELTSFLDSVRTGTPPAVTGRAGAAAVAAAEQVIASLQAHHWEGLDISKF